jgi:hypothetical protein
MTDKITALTDSIDALTAAVEGIGDRVADEMREARLEHRDLTLGDPPGHARIVEDLIAALPRYAAFDPADPRGERAERKCKHDAVEARFRRAVGDARRQVEACNSTATRGLLETAERELADALARRAEAEKDRRDNAPIPRHRRNDPAFDRRGVLHRFRRSARATHRRRIAAGQRGSLRRRGRAVTAFIARHSHEVTAACGWLVAVEIVASAAIIWGF